MSFTHRTEAGIAGWLRLLILFLCVLTPFVGFAVLAGDIATAERVAPQLSWNGRWYDAKVLLWASFALRSIALFYAGWRLAAVRCAASVKIAIWTLWLAGPIGIAITNLIVSGRLGEVQLGSPTPLGWPLAAAGAWSAYLLMSDRVAVTYLPAAMGRCEPVKPEVRMAGQIRLTPIQRKVVFYAVLWIAVVVVYGLILDDRYNGFFRIGHTIDVRRLAAWAVIPPAIWAVARQAYSRFVISPQRTTDPV